MNPEFENCDDCVQITTDNTPVTFPPIFTNPFEGDDGIVDTVTTVTGPSTVTTGTVDIPTPEVETPTITIEPSTITAPVEPTITATTPDEIPIEVTTSINNPVTTPTVTSVCQTITSYSTKTFESTSTSVLTRISNSKSTIITPSTSYQPVHSLVEVTSGIRYGNMSRIDYSTRTIDNTMTVTLYLVDIIDVLITQLTTYYYVYPTQSVNSVLTTSCHMDPVITIPGDQTVVTPVPTAPTSSSFISSTSPLTTKSTSPSSMVIPTSTVTIINPCEANIFRGRAGKLELNYILLLIGLII